MLKRLFVRDLTPLTPLCGGSGSPYCETDEVCRCDQYEAESNVKIKRHYPGYRMPSGEMDYIPLPDLMERWNEERDERFWFWSVVVLGLAFLIMLACGFIPR